MTNIATENLPVRKHRGHKIAWVLQALRGDAMALAATIWLLIVVLAIFADTFSLIGDNRISLKARNLAPFDFSQAWTLWLGADALGRPLLVRLVQAASTTIMIAMVTVLTSLVSGTILGVIAGYFGGVVGNIIMRISDIILGFPTLLVALFGLYLFGPSVFNLITVLAITRMPAYIRVARAETLEARERLFVDAARVFGGGPLWILRKHILPSVAPTMLTLASVNLATVMLFESGLSYLGLGIQPPAVSWGLMVAQGQGYLATAWWLGFFPGLAVMLTTMSFNLLANWFRIVNDPSQHWRLIRGRR